MVTNPDCARRDEVHFHNRVLFIINNALTLDWKKLSRLQSKGYLVQKLCCLVLLGIEEEPKLVKNVVEQIVHNDRAPHWPRKGCDELVCLLYVGKPVVDPKVLKVIVDLYVKTLGQRLVVPEAGNQSYPVVQLKGLFFKTWAFELGNNLDETTHNERKKGDARDHH